MTKRLLILAAGAALPVAALFAQTSPMASSFQQHGWIAAPGFPTFGTEMQGGLVTGKPFYGTEVRRSVQTLGDGTHVEDSNSSSFYRDAEGRMRSESKTQALVYDPVAGFVYNLMPAKKTYYKSPVHANATYSIAAIGNRTSISSSTSDHTSSTQGHGQAAPGKAEHKALVSNVHSQAVTEDLPPQVINGLLCRGSRITETIPAGTFGNDRDVKIVSERWYSDDLQVLVKTTNSDPRFGTATYDLTNAVQAPPDPALFRIPADYSEQSTGHGVGQGFPNQGK